jgi:putative transposase
MALMGIEAIYRKKRTSLPAKGHRIYPYVLRNVIIERPNQVWATAVTYLPMAQGFAYLVAILDLYSRKVLAFRVSTTLAPDFCIEALGEALRRHGAPEIFNTDQGSQFTDADFTAVLAARGVRISMDGKGRWIDNVFVERLWRSVKYESIYLHAYETPREVRVALARYLSRPAPGVLRAGPLANSPTAIPARSFSSSRRRPSPGRSLWLLPRRS